MDLGPSRVHAPAKTDCNYYTSSGVGLNSKPKLMVVKIGQSKRQMCTARRTVRRCKSCVRMALVGVEQLKNRNERKLHVCKYETIADGHQVLYDLLNAADLMCKEGLRQVVKIGQSKRQMSTARRIVRRCKSCVRMALVGVERLRNRNERKLRVCRYETK